MEKMPKTFQKKFFKKKCSVGIFDTAFAAYLEPPRMRK